jgi:prevent-host-death family protein
MTMVKVERVAAGEFKAKCLSLLDDVALTGKELIVTKRGKPVAKLVPVTKTEAASLLESIVWEGDIISPIGEGWDAAK